MQPNIWGANFLCSSPLSPLSRSPCQICMNISETLSSGRQLKPSGTTLYMVCELCWVLTNRNSLAMSFVFLRRGFLTGNVESVHDLSWTQTSVFLNFLSFFRELSWDYLLFNGSRATAFACWSDYGGRQQIFDLVSKHGRAANSKESASFRIVFFKRSKEP